MAKSKPKKRSAQPASAVGARGGLARDSAAMTALTVGWMLTCLGALAAELLSVAILAVARPWPPDPHTPHAAAPLAGVLVMTALITGLLCLVLTPLVCWLRPTKPPLALVVAAVLVGLAPMATLGVLSWLF